VSHLANSNFSACLKGFILHGVAKVLASVNMNKDNINSNLTDKKILNRKCNHAAKVHAFRNIADAPNKTTFLTAS